MGSEKKAVSGAALSPGGSAFFLSSSNVTASLAQVSKEACCSDPKTLSWCLISCQRHVSHAQMHGDFKGPNPDQESDLVNLFRDSGHAHSCWAFRHSFRHFHSPKRSSFCQIFWGGVPALCCYAGAPLHILVVHLQPFTGPSTQIHCSAGQLEKECSLSEQRLAHLAQPSISTSDPTVVGLTKT